jgi:hypothetical protein
MVGLELRIKPKSALSADGKRTFEKLHKLTIVGQEVIKTIFLRGI